MDSISNGSSIITEEDRISNLPDDIIYHILSFMDMKYAIQTSMLSRKWKLVWISMPQLNLNSDTFCSLHRFGKFVMDVLSHRNRLTEVSAVTLKLRGSITMLLVAHIIAYAKLRNLRQLTIWYSATQHELPRYLFVSHTLKHLTLVNHFSSLRSCTPNSAWDFPALETLNLTCIRLGDGIENNLNPFSNCVNLRDITLHKCSMKGLEVFNVCAPQLRNFTITEASVLPKVLNIVAPQLETLTASLSVATCSEGLASRSNFLHLSTSGFNALEKVNISMSNCRLKKERHVPSLLNLFWILRTVKVLTLDVDVIESLSSCLDQVSREPCPFDNLKCLKIDTTPLKQRDCIPTIPIIVRKYLLENSPDASFIMDLPLVPQKRSRQQGDSDTVTKVAKLEAEKKLPGIMAKEKRTLESKTQRQDQFISKQKEELPVQSEFNGQLMAKIRMQDQLIAQHKAEIPVQFQVSGQLIGNIRMQDQLIAQQKAEIPVQSQVDRQLNAKIRMQDQLIAQQKAEIPVKSQADEQLMAKIRMQDQLIAQHKAKLHMCDRIIPHHKSMLRAKIKGRDRIVAEQKEMFEVKMQMQDQVNGHQLAKIRMHDQLITQQKAELPVQSQVNGNQMAKIRMHDQVIAQQKANLQEHFQVNGHQIAKIGMQDQLIAQRKVEIPVQFQANGQLIGNIRMQDQLIAQQKTEIPVQSQVDRQLNVKIQMQDHLIAQQKAEIPVKFQANEQLMAKIRMQDQLIAQQKAEIRMQSHVNGRMIEKIQMQDQVIAQQKATIQMHDQLIAQHKSMIRAKIKRRDQPVAKQNEMFETKMQMQDQLVAKQKEIFEAKMQMQDQVTAKLKLAAQNLQHEKLTLQIIKGKMAEFKVQVESGNPNYEVIRSVGRDIKSAMDLIPCSLRVNVQAEFSFSYDLLKAHNLTHIDASHWARIETELGHLRLFERFYSNHSHSQTHVYAAEPLAAPRPSPANMTASSRLVSGASDMVVQPSQSPRM